ncbi:type I-B CRISPR-associated protein Cas8b1/Cst1 [Siphonobacter sp. BAB-5405]|uniref:type I-B CRISPR-associated protein Cas8b1/Cst1 n=1 Tax=Siphonobacter sp. BAB-5405 TaxID=1864825 RepID=UPI000C8050F1|nr:type I-B CRISPR-associated protein Cas8b1/Cst1 [Siphonobacter sp. BAB-5405]PMD90539.1 type I-B CRISPR-associated protein Cas8b1/Cst1 [Siphonobacter sp. BAB-5405]
MELVLKENLTHPTGDPFADAGGYVIASLWKEPALKDKDILGLIEYVANLYINQWNANLHAFFLNSKITQPAFDRKRKLEETLTYYRSILNETAPSKMGYCRVSGRKANLFVAGRDNHILSGSSTFINFHHGFENGLYVSKEIIVRFFFVPLGVMQLGDKLGLISSNNTIVANYYVEQLLTGPDGHLNAVGRGLSSGVARSNYGIPANALFAFVDSCLKNIKTAIYANSSENVVEARNTSLSLYHFTNFGAKPEVVLYQLSATVFGFYALCQSITYYEIWHPFVASHYRNSKFKDAEYNQGTDTWVSPKEELAYDSYSTWRNPILERLLNGQTLVPYFKAWIRTHRFPFQLIETYLIYINQMDKRTVQKIKDIAGFIVSRDEDSIKKAILRLNRAKYVQEVRQYLLKLIDDNYKGGAQEPLLKIDEVEYLFPETVSWREIRDLLLIAVYEKLHEKNLHIATEFEEQNEVTEPLD